MSTAIFEIFRMGKHNGIGVNAKGFWSASQLDQIAQFYNQAIKPAPLVIGHPEDDKPEYGTVKRLINHEGALFAEAEIDRTLIQRIKNGDVSGISASFYPKGNDQNPIKQLGYYLKHVGFLEQGKQNPAVKGMLDPKISLEYLSYSEINTDFILFCEDEENLSYAQKYHRKVAYLSNVLNVSYAEAVQIIERRS
jgi:hypothetical protein